MTQKLIGVISFRHRYTSFHSAEIIPPPRPRFKICWFNGADGVERCGINKSETITSRFELFLSQFDFCGNISKGNCQVENWVFSVIGKCRFVRFFCWRIFDWRNFENENFLLLLRKNQSFFFCWVWNDEVEKLFISSKPWWIFLQHLHKRKWQHFLWKSFSHSLGLIFISILFWQMTRGT